MKTYSISIDIDDSIRSKRRDDELADAISKAVALARFPDVSVTFRVTKKDSVQVRKDIKTIGDLAKRNS